MNRGSHAMADVHARLDWATRLHDDVQRAFADFAKPGGPDERPLGINFREKHRPAGMVVARFIVERPLPTEMRRAMHPFCPRWKRHSPRRPAAPPPGLSAPR